MPDYLHIRSLEMIHPASIDDMILGPTTGSHKRLDIHTLGVLVSVYVTVTPHFIYMISINAVHMYL